MVLQHFLECWSNLHFTPRIPSMGILYTALLQVGDTVRMETVITGTPTPKLMWLHNGKQLKPGKKVKLKKRTCQNDMLKELLKIALAMMGEAYKGCLYYFRSR